MTDPSSYARQARTALAEAASATLLVQGIGHCRHHGPAVVLHERDGRPQLICAPDSPISAAARAAKPALLTVENQSDGTVVFAGTLVLEETQHLDGGAVDVVAQYAARVLAHTNHTHATQVRRFAARQHGVAESSIAAARVTALDSTGLHIEWVDEHGGHSLERDFAMPATTPTELALALRSEMDG